MTVATQPAYRPLRAPVRTPVVRFIPTPAASAKINRMKAKTQLINRAEGPSSNNEPKSATILRDVAKRYGMTPREIMVSARGERSSRARQEIMYRLRAEAGLSGPVIAREMGLSCHTVVLYGVSAHSIRSGLPVPVGKLHHLVKKRTESNEPPKRRGRPRKQGASQVSAMEN